MTIKDSWREHGIDLSVSAAQGSLLRGWLTAPGYQPCTVQEDESTESVRKRAVRTLISYYPSATWTTAAVTTAVSTD